MRQSHPQLNFIRASLSLPRSKEIYFCSSNFINKSCIYVIFLLLALALLTQRPNEGLESQETDNFFFFAKNIFSNPQVFEAKNVPASCSHDCFTSEALGQGAIQNAMEEQLERIQGLWSGIDLQSLHAPKCDCALGQSLETSRVQFLSCQTGIGSYS